MKYLECEVAAYNEVVLFRVIRQEPDFTKWLRDRGLSYKAENGWQIKTDTRPELYVYEDRTQVYLRGSNKEYDNAVVGMVDRGGDAEKLIQALREVHTAYVASLSPSDSPPPDNGTLLWSGVVI